MSAFHAHLFAPIAGDDDKSPPDPVAHPRHVRAVQVPLATDGELMARIRRDDGHALDELVCRHVARLGTVAYAILGSDDLAQDAVQDVFIALWRQRHQLESIDNVAAYLSRAIRNRALNALKHEHAEHRATERLALATDAASQTASNSAEDDLSAADVKHRVYAALRHLPSGPREAFLLYWEHDLTYQEIAATLGLTVANVRQQMHRATRSLARRLMGEGTD